MPSLANKRNAEKIVTPSFRQFPFIRRHNKRRLLVTDLLPSITSTFQDLKANYRFRHVSWPVHHTVQSDCNELESTAVGGCLYCYNVHSHFRANR